VIDRLIKEAATLDREAQEMHDASAAAASKSATIAELGKDLSRQFAKVAKDELGELDDAQASQLLGKLDRLMVVHAKRWHDTSSTCAGMATAKIQQAAKLRQIVEDDTPAKAKKTKKKTPRSNGSQPRDTS